MSDYGTLLAEMRAKIEAVEKERDAYRNAVAKMLAALNDHMTACDRIMGATHPCTCGANDARRLLAESSDIGDTP